MIKFCQPCLQYKLWAAYKTHWGFPGLLSAPAPGYATRYLTKSVQLISTLVFPGGQTQIVTDNTDVTSIDRITGVVTYPPNRGTFPDPTATVASDPRWSVTSDTTATFDAFVPFNTFDPSQGGERTQYFLELSNEYTLGQLETDVDALMSTIDVSTIPPMNLKQVVYPGDAVNFNQLGFMAQAAIPGAYLYDHLGDINNQLSYQPKLKAAAFTAYIPVSGDLVFLTYRPGLVKLASQIALAGNYCLKTFTVDYSQNPAGTPQCVSGQGTCNGWIGVAPPALASGVNTYKLVVPNCQCGA